MRVVLLKDIKGIGKKGEIKELSAGHVRNFLLPKGLAAPASDKAVRFVEQEVQKKARHERRQKNRAKTAVRGLKGLLLEFEEPVSEGGALYAALSSQKISRALKDRGFPVEKDQVVISETIKEPGEYEIEVVFRKQGVSAMVRCIVREAEKKSVK